MQKSLVVAVSLLLVAASAFAQQRSRPNSVSIFVTDVLVSYSSVSGSKASASYGASFDHMFNDRFSGELSVSSQRFHEYLPTFGTTQSVVSHRLYPIDATVSYHFFTSGRWKPYVSGGLRYVTDNFHGSGSQGEYRISTRAVDPEISGGITFQFNPSLGLRFDAKQIVGTNHSRVGDPDLKTSVGLSFRF